MANEWSPLWWFFLYSKCPSTVHKSFPAEPSRFMLGLSPACALLCLPWQITAKFQKAPCCPPSMPLKMLLLCPGNSHPSLSSLLSTHHDLRYSPGRYHLLKGAFPESRLCFCQPVFIPSEHQSHFHGCQSLLSLRQHGSHTQARGALPSSKSPNLGLVLERPLLWLSPGSAPSPRSNKSEKPRQWSQLEPRYSFPCHTLWN